ncbi:MAG: type II toxin-antitoxin system RelB/DinJ family antitoxin [Clostridiales bacterium]|jgi:addiction module RelB/DinJ family antitoxin|nr:type II toxin-antitoxin system RelB/DinJ family antitoxin [Clostridiales bacterium]
MQKTTSITTRVTPEIKRKAEEITAQLGLNVSEAISIFLAQLVLQHGIPFDVSVPPLIYDGLEEDYEETIKSVEDGTATMWRTPEEVRKGLGLDV